ncbi:hypothetical protein ACSVC9_12075 [Clostridium sp. LBM24168]
MNYKNLQITKIIDGQTLITCGINRYRVDEIRDDNFISYNLLKEKNLHNNPTRKIRHRFIKDFRSMEEVLDFIQRKNNYSEQKVS